MAKSLMYDVSVGKVDANKVIENLDNALVHQKNEILDLVNRNLLALALEHLEFVRELWTVCEYSYKYTEIRERIRKLDDSFV